MTPDAPDSWSPIDLRSYLDGTYEPEYPTLLRRSDGIGLFYAGRVHSLHGEPESGKSMVAIAEAARQISDGFRVVYVDFESDAATIAARLLAFGADPDVILESFVYLRPDADPSGPSWERLLSQPAALFVIDGITEAFSVSRVASKDNDETTTWLRRVAKAAAERTGAAVVLIDHVIKSDEGRGRFAIGAQAKLAALTGAAYTVEIDKPLGRGMVGVLKLRVGKDRPGNVRPHCGSYRRTDRTQLAATVTIDSSNPDDIVFSIEPPNEGPDDAVSDFRPTTLMERVSRALEAANEPLSTAAIRAAVTGKNSAIDKAIAVLVADGLVTTSPGPRNATVHKLVHPYRADDDKGGARWTDPVVAQTTVDPAPSNDGGRGARSMTAPWGALGRGRGEVENHG